MMKEALGVGAQNRTRSLRDGLPGIGSYGIAANNGKSLS